MPETQSDLIEVQIPFGGFYESWHSTAIDRATESAFSDPDGNGDDPIEGLPDDAYMRIDYRAIEREYVADYAFLFGNEYGLTIDPATVELVSPREYNFSTDRIAAKVNRAEFDTIRRSVESDPSWPAYVRENCTSYSGFTSFYSNDSTDSDWTRETLEFAQTRLVLEFHAIAENGQDWELDSLEYVNAYELQALQTETGKVLDAIDATRDPKPIEPFDTALSGKES